MSLFLKAHPHFVSANLQTGTDPKEEEAATIQPEKLFAIYSRSACGFDCRSGL
jgi:hypothetical protein